MQISLTPSSGVPKGTGEVTLGVTQTLGAGACSEQNTPLVLVAAGASPAITTSEGRTANAIQKHLEIQIFGIKIVQKGSTGAVGAKGQVRRGDIHSRGWGGRATDSSR